MRRKVLRVAILVDTATGWGRRLIRGIAAYAEKYGPWQLQIEDRGRDDPMRLPPGWNGDGVIARISTPAIARRLRATGLPVVNVSAIQLRRDTSFPRVTNGPHDSARLASEHFLDRGFRHFAYCGFPFLPSVQQHCQTFVEELAKRGLTCDVYQPSGKTAAGGNWRVLREDLGRWLHQLPKPVAIFTWATRRGREIIETCQAIGLDVPHDVAVLGGDDDELLCSIGWPSLSGIVVASEQIGHEAAAVLDRMMKGKSAPKKPIHIQPTGIAVRHSTDVLAINDAELAHAIRYIRSHAFEPIQVGDLLQAIPISRRSLERRFKHILGRSPVEEIRRIRIARAKRLLAETDMQIPQIAAAVGFGTAEYLITLFKQECGLTPRKYRSQVRTR